MCLFFTAVKVVGKVACVAVFKTGRVRNCKGIHLWK